MNASAISARPAGPRLSWPHILRFMRDPIAFYEDARRRWPDPFLLRSPNGPLFITARPELIREVLTADPEGYDTWGAAALAPFVGPSSLLLASGARHRRDRKLLTPPFHGERMRAYGEAMQVAARSEVASWQPGVRFVLLEAMQRISLRVIVETVFGIREDAAARAWSDRLVDTMEAASPLVFFLPALQRDFGGMGPWARFQRALRRLDGMILDEIAQRRQAADAREDVLSLLLAARDDAGEGLSDRELRDQLMTLLVAGHETTAMTLTWALYELIRHDALRARVLAELGDERHSEVLSRLPLLDAVCQETLRMHPVVADIVRQPLRPMTLGGIPVPAGAALMPAIASVHFDASIFPEPHAFRPERFLERRFTPFEFLPFGGGARRCLGAAFALYEVKLVLAEVLRAGSLSLAETGPVRNELRGITMGPRGGVRVRFAPGTPT